MCEILTWKALRTSQMVVFKGLLHFGNYILAATTTQKFSRPDKMWKTLNEVIVTLSSAF